MAYKTQEFALRTQNELIFSLNSLLSILKIKFSDY